MLIGAQSRYFEKNLQSFRLIQGTISHFVGKQLKNHANCIQLAERKIILVHFSERFCTICIILNKFIALSLNGDYSETEISRKYLKKVASFN